MNDQELRTKVQKALDNKLSGIKENPWLAQRIMNRADEEEPVMKKKLSFGIVFVVVAVLVLGTALAVALNTEFFSHVFGNETRKNVTEHMETFDNGKGGTYDYLYPAREYVGTDPELAEKLIGSQLMNDPVTVQIGNYTLTVLNAVRDENAMVMEMTLECPTGVKGLNYDRLTNEGKGAWFADDAEYFFGVDGAAEMMYVDMQNSTENCLRIYYYCVFFEKPADGESPVLTAAAVSAETGSGDKVFEPQEIVVPADKAVSTVRYTAENGSLIELAPFSLRVCPNAEADSSITMAQDPKSGNEPAIVISQMEPDSLSDLVIEMKDGKTFTVLGGDKLDNTMYMCGGLGESFQYTSMVLNRLVDPQAVKCIRINGTSYLPEELTAIRSAREEIPEFCLSSSECV